LSTQHRKKRQWNGQSFGSGRFLLAVTAAFVLLALGAFSPAAAQEPAKPLFELGIAGGAGYVPDYPAADQSHLQYLALPYFAYRGKFLRSDEKGLLRGRFVRTRNVELDVSLSGSFAIDSDDNDARRGMPDLDYLGEVGPRLQITIARAARHAKIDLELPLRAVFSTGLSDLDYRGVTFSPAITYQHEQFFGPTEIKLGIAAIFGTEELMSYFYEVEPRFITPTRRAFAPDAGYLGAQLELLASRQLFSRLRVFLAGRIFSHHGATNDDSPLFRDRTTASIGAGLVISLYHSKHRGSD
jgi:outer membrane scaffolding protein for murein synthesis (MipA/OmpV family)